MTSEYIPPCVVAVFIGVSGVGERLDVIAAAHRSRHARGPLILSDRTAGCGDEHEDCEHTLHWQPPEMKRCRSAGMASAREILRSGATERYRNLAKDSLPNASFARSSA